MLETAQKSLTIKQTLNQKKKKSHTQNNRKLYCIFTCPFLPAPWRGAVQSGDTGPIPGYFLWA